MKNEAPPKGRKPTPPHQLLPVVAYRPKTSATKTKPSPRAVKKQKFGDLVTPPWASATFQTPQLFALPIEDAGATHYAINMRPKRLLAWAQSAGLLIENEFGAGGRHEKDIPLFIYRGSSGIIIATALSQQLAANYPDICFGMMMVRKPGEQSHGLPIEMYNYENLARKSVMVIFVDDFVSSGETLRRTFTEIENAKKTTYAGSYLSQVEINPRKYRMLLTQFDGFAAKLESVQSYIDTSRKPITATKEQP